MTGTFESLSILKSDTLSEFYQPCILKKHTIITPHCHCGVLNSVPMLLRHWERWQSIATVSSRQSCTERTAMDQTESSPLMLSRETRWKNCLVGYSLISLHDPQNSTLSHWKAQNELIQQEDSSHTLKIFIVSLCIEKVRLKQMNSKYFFRFSTSWSIKKM